MPLTPEERQRIYEEEKARIEAQEKVKTEIAKAKKAEEKAKSEKEQMQFTVGCLAVVAIGGRVGPGITPWDPSAERLVRISRKPL